MDGKKKIHFKCTIQSVNSKGEIFHSTGSIPTVFMN